MKKIILFFGLALLANTAVSQELNCTVQVNAQKTGQPNLPIFKTLENAITEFLNQTNWTNTNYEEHEKIDCTFFINILSYKSGSFKATIQVRSSRPVYKSSFSTPVFLMKDEDFSFEYIEFENLEYNPNNFESNLTSVLAFYVYTILGMDADTFSPLGGTPYFQEAQKIVSNARQSNYQGWNPGDGDQSRYRLNADIISPEFEVFRKALYLYHRKGLDQMYEDVKLGKQKVAEAINMLGQLGGINSSSIVLRAFFDAKSTEIEKIFSGGPSVDITDAVETLNDLAPQYSKKWKNIRY